MGRLLLVALLLGVAGCEGPMGPAGPKGDSGAQGPQGPAGPGSISYFLTGQLDGNGQAVAQLPAGAGTITQLPQISCYVSDTATGAYLQLGSDTYEGNYCAIVPDSGRLYVVIFMGNSTGGGATYAGWHYQVVARPQNG